MYKYQGKELTQEIAVDLIVELFAGQNDVQLADIKNDVDKLHTKRGGHESSREVHPVTHVLYALKTLGLAIVDSVITYTLVSSCEL